jgi:DNA repair protein RadA/Sms
MSNKTSTIYVCSNCDAQFPKWSGRCLTCGAWGSLSQEVSEAKSKKAIKDFPSAKLINLSEINLEEKSRHQTKIGELDRVLGGGIVPGSLILLSGEPGIGKSTVVAQLADALAKNKKEVIYVSGEESASQVKDRLLRLNCDITKIKFISETNVEKICSAAYKEKPELLIIDSIQTVYSSMIDSEAGNVSQIRASAVKFLEIAKQNDVAVILIGHITKDGQIAGPKSLEHIVDTVIQLEVETSNDFRILRATKNRFGSVNELGIFEMTGSGLKEVKSSSSVFLGDNQEKIPGSVVSCIIEGTRPFLVEIQALVTKTVFGYPQRKASGFDVNRLQVLTAVLNKRANVNLSNQDVILNIVGGLKINDPAIDLAVCLAMISSLLNQPISRDVLVLGEVGLAGELRNVSKIDDRLREAEKINFRKAVVSNTKIKNTKLKIEHIKNIGELLDRFKK